MTGRTLYLKFCQARGRNQHWCHSDAQQLPEKPLAWEFLHWRDRSVWNDLARRLTTRKKVAPA